MQLLGEHLLSRDGIDADTQNLGLFLIEVIDIRLIS